MIKIRKYSAVIFALLLIVPIGLVIANTPTRTPDGFGKLVVFMAAGQYDHDITSDVDLIDWFKHDVMGFTDAEWEAERVKAQEWFAVQFEVTVPLESIMDNVVDPRNEYRAYIISGMDVPSDGWVVRDGGFVTMIDGKPVVYGFYSIDIERARAPSRKSNKGVFEEPIVILYKSLEPIMMDAPDNGYFRCGVVAPWGEGIAQGIIGNVDLGGNVMISNWRSVHTYNPLYGPSVIHDLAPGQ